MKIVLFANTDWYLYNFRRSLAEMLARQGHEVVLLSPPGPYGTRMREMGLHWIPAPMERRSLNPLRELKFLLWLRRLFAEERVDVVHGFTVKCAVYGSISARAASVPARVAAITGMGYVFTSQGLKARILRPLVRHLLKWALNGDNARLILQNEDDVRLVVAARIAEPAAIRVIPGSGVDCCRFTPPSVTRCPDDRPLKVLLAARLLWDKGVAEYVAAARELRAAGERVEFLLAGEPDGGNPAAVPEQQVRNWTDEGAVRWLGHVDDMPALFAEVDVVVLPSYREGLPKGLIEAAACALPLITTDVPGCREVVTDGVDGLLIPARNAEALAHAIVRLHRDAALRDRLGRAARLKALREFDERIVLSKTMAVYEELLPGALRVDARRPEETA